MSFDARKTNTTHHLDIETRTIRAAEITPHHQEKVREEKTVKIGAMIEKEIIISTIEIEISRADMTDVLRVQKEPMKTITRVIDADRGTMNV